MLGNKTKIDFCEFANLSEIDSVWFFQEFVSRTICMEKL